MVCGKVENFKANIPKHDPPSELESINERHSTIVELIPLKFSLVFLDKTYRGAANMCSGRMRPQLNFLADMKNILQCGNL